MRIQDAAVSPGLPSHRLSNRNPRCTGHSSAALTRHIPHGWSGFYKCLGTRCINVAFLSNDSSVYHGTIIPPVLCFLKYFA